MNKVTNQLQNKLWRQVWVRMDNALNAGYWLESIALQDSMINERLESLQKYATGNSVHGTLNRNIQKCKRLELLDDELIVLDKVENWKSSRNHAMHKMVKFSQTDFALDWDERLALIEACAREGKNLVRDVKNAVNRAKRRF